MSTISMHLVPYSRDITYPVSRSWEGDLVKITSSPTSGNWKGKREFTEALVCTSTFGAASTVCSEWAEGLGFDVSILMCPLFE